MEDLRMYTNKEEYLLGEYYKCKLDYQTKLEQVEQLQEDIEELKKRENELYNSMRKYAYCTPTTNDKEDTLHKNKFTFHEDYIAIDDVKTGARILINKNDEDIPKFLKRNSRFIKSILDEVELVDERDKNRLLALISTLLN